MRAQVLEAYDTALQYKKVNDPILTDPLQVIIKVKSAGVNPADYKLRKGNLSNILRFKLPVILGIDFAGEIIAVGSHVKNWKVGDSVYGKHTMPQQEGCYAEKVVVHSTKDPILRKPDNISFEEAGGIGVAALTAYTSLVDQCRLKENDGKRILVIGASGGVGSWAVQIAKALGAHVTGICSGKNVEFVKSLGADEVFDYTKPDFHSNIKPEIDAVVDTVGGEAYWEMMKPLIKTKGVYSTIVGPVKGAGSEKVNLVTLVNALASIIWRNLVSRVSYKWVIMLPPAIPDIINTWLKEGKVKPPPTQAMPLSDAMKAHEQSESGRVVGKLVLIP